MLTCRQSLLYDKMLEASSKVAFDNKHEASGYATLILSVANELGIISSTARMQSREVIKTIQCAKEWICSVKTWLDSISIGDAMDMLEPYDIMHRLAFQTPTPKEFEDKYMMKAFEARIHGDHTVNEYHLFRKIRKELKNKNKAYLDRPLQWYMISLDRWYKNFKYGSSLTELPDYDTLQIISILMSEEIFEYADGDQTHFKQQLYTNHLHLLDNKANYSYEELRALSLFLKQSAKHMTAEDYLRHDNDIMLAMISAPTTNRLHRLTLHHTYHLLTQNI